MGVPILLRSQACVSNRTISVRRRARSAPPIEIPRIPRVWARVCDPAGPLGHAIDLGRRDSDVAGQDPIVAGMAARYATALFELAPEQKALDGVKADLKRFEELLAESGHRR